MSRPSPTTPIKNDEVLWRRVLYGTGQYVLENGVLRVTATAFMDRKREPSVDRSLLVEHLHEGGAAFTAQDDNNGVVSLGTADVRGIAEARRDKNGNKLETYVADVDPRPLSPSNLAHCVVVMSPTVTEIPTMYKKLVERLKRLAKWVIPPLDMRQSDR